MKRAVSVGAVLAGGLSRRMGEPKAMVELAGRPLVARVVATVGSAGLEPVVVAKPDSPLPQLDCRVLSEPERAAPPAHRAASPRSAPAPGAASSRSPATCRWCRRSCSPGSPSSRSRWRSARSAAGSSRCSAATRPRSREPLADVARRAGRRCARRSPRSTRSSIGEDRIARFGDPRADRLQRQLPRGPGRGRGAARPHRPLHAAARPPQLADDRRRVTRLRRSARTRRPARRLTPSPPPRAGPGSRSGAPSRRAARGRPGSEEASWLTLAPPAASATPPAAAVAPAVRDGDRAALDLVGELRRDLDRAVRGG